MFTPRPYQIEAKDRIFKEWEEVDKTLLILPTGTGKTIVFSSVIRDLVSRGSNVLVLAHRGELLEQAADKLRASTGLACAVEKADETAVDALESVTVGSVQSLMRQDRLERFPPSHYTHIVVDEAHHAVTDSYTRIFDYFKDAKLLGVTATPDRGDRRSLGEVFDSIAYEYSLPQAIKDKYLAPIRAMTIPINIDLNQVDQQAGDFAAGALGEALDPYLAQIAEEISDVAASRKTLVFVPLISTAKKFAELLQAKGLNAQWVSGACKDRKDKLEAFANDETDILCNSMLLTEGYDCPAIDCVVNLRATRVRALYSQIVGRGTRPHPGKTHLLLLDFLWHSDKHSLVHPSDLLTDDKDVADAMTAKAQANPGEEIEVDEQALEEAALSVAEERERALAKQLEELRHKKRKLVDPLQWAASTEDAALLSFEDSFRADRRPALPDQIETLAQLGIDGSETSHGLADALIKKATDHRQRGFATAKQIRCLERYGFKHVGKFSYNEATKLITRIAANRWQPPRGMIPSEYVPQVHKKGEIQ